MLQGIFLARPNRFIAEVLLNNEKVIAHVPNTGRCRELLIEGVTVYLETSKNPARKTQYSLVAVDNRGYYVSIDSQLPNKVVEKALKNGQIEAFKNYHTVKREVQILHSRMDFQLLEPNHPPCFIEVKGVTLVEDSGLALFPDAPTLRGKKHLEELLQLKTIGYRSALIFLIQHPLGQRIAGNKVKDPAFVEALEAAHKMGVEIYAYKTYFDDDSHWLLGEEVPIEF